MIYKAIKDNLDRASKLILSGEIPVPGRLYVNILLDIFLPFLMFDLATMQL